MDKYAIVMMSEQGEDHPGGQGRMLHAMHAVKELREGGDEVTMWFHGIGVTWLTAFEQQDHKFTQVYRPLFDEIRGAIQGACEFCARKRFAAGPAADSLGIPTVRGVGEHHTVATLLRQGYRVLTF